MSDLKQKLVEFEKRLKELGIKYEYLDYDLSLRFFINHEDYIWICQQFRPERDGYTGYRLIDKDFLEKYITDEEFMKNKNV